MRAFEAADWFETGSRLRPGQAAVITGVDDVDPLALVGEQVQIDGDTYTVRGVEWHFVKTALKRSFALLVDRE